ncbi:hypothetical protein Phum_PHUM086050 [Pediculus humanus corporis]|uniref:Uncharacterized protein n=1 Tax=Pediculus humanus subsp. corporis TaxID=121224 RepID=E0VCD7_PEDHC|nr:uncharacterized protein Phum_PHUM086050 [Pediculus humanus corporis]EEB11043.1 hypothetical protein Phum_PHUM086050 [Pediculus humanus corporis]
MGGFFVNHGGVKKKIFYNLPQQKKLQETRSPAVDDDFPNFQDEQPSEFSIGNLLAGQAGKFFNSFLQLPSTLFKFFSGVVARQPFAKLREEVRNLNISYPK